MFYGGPPSEEDMARIGAPVYGFYGEFDNRINATLMRTIESMKQSGKTFDPLIYPGVGHGFVRNGMGETANDVYKAQTASAWNAVVGVAGKTVASQNRDCDVSLNMPMAENKPWTKRWDIIRIMDSDSDGHTAQVRNVQTNDLGVMKWLEDAGNARSRGRMAQEVINLITLYNAGCGVPRIIDKNTNAYKDIHEPLYFVREHFEPDNLRVDITENGPWPLDDVTKLVEAITDVLRTAISAEVVQSGSSPWKHHRTGFGIG